MERTSPDKGGIAARFFADSSPSLAYGLAVLIGLVHVCSWVTPGFLAGRGGYFAHGDVAQHASGWLLYAADTWRFPLLHTIRLNFPEGVSILYTDSIPLAALMLKPFARFLPHNFNYLGIWLALVVITQAASAAWLIRSLGARNLAALVCAVVFALTWPALVNQVGHTGHMTHALILCSLAVYFQGRKRTMDARAAFALLLSLSLAAMLVNIYIMLICLAVLISFLAEQGLFGERWKVQAFRLALTVASIASLAVVLGYFPWGTPSVGGFGVYSLNLSAPFVGGLFTGERIDATGGQLEGTCYLGAGVMLLCLVAIATRFRDVLGLPARYPALFAMMLLFTALALSNRVFLGRTELLHIELPPFIDRLCGIIRTSGRLVWLPAYVILFGTLAMALAGKPSRVIVLAALALTLQLADLSPLFGGFTHSPRKPAPAWSGDWDAALAEVRLVNVYPTFGCGEYDEALNKYQFIAATHQKLINTGYFARGGGACADKERVFQEKFAPDSLSVMPLSHLRGRPFQVPDGFYDAASRGECVEIEGDLACRPGKRLDAWLAQGFAANSFSRFPDAHFGPDKFGTQVGQVREGTLSAGPDAGEGYLAFGPHTLLYPGRYRFTLAYRGFAPAGRPVGRWDCLVGKNAPFDAPIASGELDGTGGEQRGIEGFLDVRDPGGAYLDLRLYYQGGGELRFIGLDVERLGQ